MHDLLLEIEEALRAELYSVALFCSLAVPDICGAIESADGRSTQLKYVAWFDTHVSHHFAGRLTGRQVYAFRCAVLHQGQATHHNLGYSRILFLAPRPGVSANADMNVMNGALNLDLCNFVTLIVIAARSWLETIQQSPSALANLGRHMRRHRGGLPNFIEGADVLA